MRNQGIVLTLNLPLGYSFLEKLGCLPYNEPTLQPNRVLARILKIQNSKFLNSCPYSATNLLQILIPTTFNSLFCQKGQFTLESYPRKWDFSQIFGYNPKKVQIKNSSKNFFSCPKRSFFLGNCLSNTMTGWTGPSLVPATKAVRRSGCTADWMRQFYMIFIMSVIISIPLSVFLPSLVILLSSLTMVQM